MSQATGGKPGVTYKWNLNVSQLMLEYLHLEGVTTLFGIPGGALIYVMNELKRQQDRFRFVICRHETGAAYIAHGYSTVTDGLGVVLTTSGPAATNALTGTMNAQASGASLLTITGEVAQQYFGRGYLQEGIDARLDVAAVFANAVQYSTVISSQAHFATLFQQALRVARSIPAGAAHISLPNDVAASCVIAPPDPDRKGNKIPIPTSPEQYRTQPGGTDPDKVARAFAYLAEAKKPLIFLGNGCRRALRLPERLKAFEALVEKYAIPVMTTPDAKGIFPESHEFSLRNYGMTACKWPDLYMRSTDQSDVYDVLVVLGSSLGELATSVVASDNYSKILVPSDNFVQVDLDQTVIGRDFPITLGIVGEAGATIDLLCEHGRGGKPPPGAPARKELIQRIKQIPPFGDPAGRQSDAAPIHPAALVRVINEEMTSGHVFIDAGNCVGWSLNNMVVDPPLHYHSALDMGPMGFGVGAVIGGKLGAPDQHCLAIVGDGAFMMHGAEVSTAAQSRVGAVWVVLYDNDLSMVSQGMAELFPPGPPWADYYKLGNPDLVKFSEGLGARAVAIMPDQGSTQFQAELRAALERAMADQQPQVIIAYIDTVAMPPYGWPKAPIPDCGPA
jgi:acetolactate synthase-1/2/3 large subunit